MTGIERQPFQILQERSFKCGAFLVADYQAIFTIVDFGVEG